MERNPGGSSMTWSPCDIQTGIEAGRSASSGLDGSESVIDGVAVLALVAGRDASAERVREQLHAVADAEHRAAPRRDVRGQRGRAVLVDGGRPAGEHEALDPQVVRVLGRRVPGHELRVDAGLADAAGDQHRELRAVVEDDDGLGRVGGGREDLAGLARLGDLEVRARPRCRRKCGSGRRAGCLGGFGHAVLVFGEAR